MIRIGQLEFNYPILCISIVNDTLIFTTKKIASRYVEELSSISNSDDKDFKTINFKIFNRSVETDSIQYDKRLQVGLYNFEWTSSSYISSDEFFDYLKINNIGELFTNKILEKYRFIFITRDPFDRFLTGYFEKIDSVLGNIQNNQNGYHIYGLIKKLFQIEDYKQLSLLPQNKINNILNNFSESITHEIFNDEHISLWNIFLLDFLQKHNIKNKVTVVDLNNFNLYGKTQQPSNKPWLTNWMKDNPIVVNNMFTKFDEYFNLEKQAYNSLVYE